MHVLALMILLSLSGTALTMNATKTVQAKPLPGTPGVLFVPQGDVIFTSTAWHLAFSINISSIEVDLANIKKVFKLSRSNQSHPIDFRMMKRLEKTITSVEKEYEHLLQETQQVMEIRTREARSLNPIDWISGSLGSIARELFGVASAEDVNRLNAYVEVLYAKDKKIATLQTLHITALRQMEGQIQRQKEQLTSLVNLTTTLFGTLMPGITDRRTLSTTVLFLHGDMATTLTTFRNTIQQLLRVVDMLHKGYLSPEIVPLHELADALHHVQTQIPMSMQLVYGGVEKDRNDLYPYYHNQLASILPGKKDIRGVLQIPIAEAKNHFRIYQVIPFPSRVKGPDAKQRFRWTGADTFVAMTKDHEKYTELGPWFTSASCIPGPPMVCPAHMAFATDPRNSCLFQLLTAEVHAQDGRCPFETVEEGVTIVRAVSEVEWVVTTNEILAVKPSCLDPENPSLPITKMHGFTITGETMVIIPRHCTANIGDYMIPLRLRVTTGESGLKNNLQPFDFPVNDLLQLQGDILEEDHLKDQFMRTYKDLTALNENLTTYDHTSEDVYGVIAQMSNVTEEMKKLEPVWITHYMSFGGWILLILAIAVTIAVALKFRRQILTWTTDWSSMLPSPSNPANNVQNNLRTADLPQANEPILLRRRMPRLGALQEGEEEELEAVL